MEQWTVGARLLRDEAPVGSRVWRGVPRRLLDGECHAAIRIRHKQSLPPDAVEP